MKDFQQCVKNLIALLDSSPALKEGLAVSISKAAFADIKTVNDYYHFLDRLLTEIPTRAEMSPSTDKFHYLISQSPDDILKKDIGFRNWLREFSQSHGSYLDTTESAAALQTFISDPEYHMEDYQAGPSGWLTFNQFFTRHVKPGRRPVAGLCDDSIIVSATDSVYKGVWAIDEDSQVTAKGVKYRITDLLDGSRYAAEFRDGVFTHSYLNTNDYHRFHLPVAGTIREARVIPGDVIVNTSKKADGSFETMDDVGFQFTQTRGVVVVESPLGLVAVLPIGMGHVSSVTLTAEEGIKLVKGEEFGYFAYGGSDMVMLFQANKVTFTAVTGQHYKQGEAIARAVNSHIN